MSPVSLTADGFGKSSANRAGETFPQFGETNDRVISKIKELYEYPAMIFGRWLGISDKTAKRKLNRERGLSVEEIGILIRSERGFEIVAAIMGDAKPAWWRVVVPLMDAADIRKMQLAAQRRIAKALEGALDADSVLRATITKAETLAFQDEEHMRNHIDALRSMGGSQDRPVARKR
jgi:hypothetical protein